jgi:hypothetical protein
VANSGWASRNAYMEREKGRELRLRILAQACPFVRTNRTPSFFYQPSLTHTLSPSVRVCVFKMDEEGRSLLSTRQGVWQLARGEAKRRIWRRGFTSLVGCPCLPNLSTSIPAGACACAPYLGQLFHLLAPARPSSPGQVIRPPVAIGGMWGLLEV